ncbi:MAG TPA: HAD family phosphatase [Hungateiclostridium thermocellum]|mgnify:FL=1|uniref:HAD-superfamily hydrolase, subfamily IA, variant 3 n=2 Tax=Acetivibrio thermocellus TaxID=1515 RepID=A3DJZ0_ACET2|nr:HAD family phosphatase [Acetivibrio thermocellus]CDG37552.1 HAD family hydrolase [Acetivibrio thermocellus BC1]ABN54269.1 HAD-superfamily hydrolase, subfamily IA, variant 3 [Acetivibrio thermocellus ATCC 27405]ADU73703.1 HAD-superfamily hydrolase, subfamily IA, variant 3 [Acetivibrio thermocellus DSM 1313]ALX07633.1 HAD-superfamily hydrolase, subfamily IA, variant 3 [Acetivibrio thermocellus AD2]ANV75375.1 HAD-superfamily hydrolase, subfamily IA, variant 3 [Acetivibrio thermocellus DSM 2360
MKKVKAVIFDMDGLMIDTERLYFEVERIMARKFGKEVKDETLWKMMGRKPLEAITVFAEDLELDISPKKLLEIRDELFVKKLVNEVEPMPGLFDILNILKGKVKMAIATGSPQKFLKIVLDKLKIESYFDVFVTSDEVEKGKPDPEVYNTAVKRLKVAPFECVVLEDSSNGALAAVRAGCYTIAVPTVYTNKQDFSFVNYVAKDLKDAAEKINEFLCSQEIEF